MLYSFIWYADEANDKYCQINRTALDLLLEYLKIFSLVFALQQKLKNYRQQLKIESKNLQTIKYELSLSADINLC